MLSPLLNAFAVYPIPPSDLHLGTNLTLRTSYYEVFLLSGAFTASGCLLWALEYAVGAQVALLRLSRVSVQLLIYLLMSLPLQLCIVTYPFTNYRTFLLPLLACATAAIGLAVAHKRWLADAHPQRHRWSRRWARHPWEEGTWHEPVELPSESGYRNFNPTLAANRFSLYIGTSLCIFSRDLPCWNLRFSKAMAFGTGLMDMGIGCFVICLGAVGPSAVRPLHLVKKNPSLRRCTRQSALLALFGVCISLHRLWRFGFEIPCEDDFPAEWREYGVHWNAFYSLAVARLLGTCLELLLLPKRCPPLLAAAGFAAVHEVLLSRGIATFVLAPGIVEPHNRSNLIGQNREGLASVPGLLTLYLAGLQLGRWARDWTVAEDRGTAPRRATVKIAGLLAGALAWRLLMVRSGGWLLPESRRLVSPSYCACVVAFTCFCLLWIRLLMALRRELSISNGCLLQVEHLASLDRAGFVSFLIGNLVCGLFNGFLDAFEVNREEVIGCGRLCLLMALGYSVGLQWVSLVIVEYLRRLKFLDADSGDGRRQATGWRGGRVARVV